MTLCLLGSLVGLKPQHLFTVRLRHWSFEGFLRFLWWKTTELVANNRQPSAFFYILPDTPRSLGTVPFSYFSSAFLCFFSHGHCFGFSRTRCHGFFRTWTKSSPGMSDVDEILGRGYMSRPSTLSVACRSAYGRHNCYPQDYPTTISCLSCFV